ncbi:MAG TPA: phosphotransferase family protein, partial [Acidimicrobiales bacterium]|nr:phosphotransferase family protein [Acidimicrobiales bacterium]
MTPDELADRLTHVLRRELDDPDLAVGDLRRLTGGASRETWAFTAGGERFVLQRARPGSPRGEAMADEAALLRAAAAAGVPVAAVVSASGDPAVLGAGYLVSRFVDGETIARKILRDDAYATARSRLAADCGRALAGIHSIPTDVVPLERGDQVAQYREVLDGFGDPHPTFEHAFRWLEANRPAATGEALVHGDFRLGNLMVGPDGLEAVVDWELAHVGDPMEDLGWLCTRAWRFGAPGPVAGVGPYEQLFDAYADASGQAVDPDVVRWWEVLGTLKWGIMCIIQARSHLDGHVQSMELAAIGRRVCEQEHDLLLLLEPDALAAAAARPLPGATDEPGLHGRPTAAELLDAVRGWVAGDVRDQAQGRVGFHSRVAENV